MTCDQLQHRDSDMTTAVTCERCSMHLSDIHNGDCMLCVGVSMPSVESERGASSCSLRAAESTDTLIDGTRPESSSERRRTDRQNAA
ncbi:hypothetical protein JZ751_021955 [Albula glossodonta]|uniref:Uncharacterized protein n=1 Tax=Albula glossodonta TaxID=121402 RepID=A0A8T2MTC3_9TELE|nr:hypothetical protein JZ751_021955 [Albula glossodonta]